MVKTYGLTHLALAVRRPEDIAAAIAAVVVLHFQAQGSVLR